MSAYTPEQLAEILRLHAMWLRGEDGGKRANLSGAILTGAILTGAILTGAILSGADLSGADLSGTDLSVANLRWTTLREAGLRGADLSGADLSGAILCRVDLRNAIGIILGPQRSDGYFFWLTHDGAGYRVRAGCRDFTFTEAREHWAKTRGGTPLGDETMAILDYLEARAPSMILPEREAAG